MHRYLYKLTFEQIANLKSLSEKALQMTQVSDITNLDDLTKLHSYTHQYPKFFEIQNSKGSKKTRKSRKTVFLDVADRTRRESPYLDVEDAAQFLRKTPRAIYHLNNKGVIRGTAPQRKLLFRRTDLERFAESNKEDSV